ncbi:MAG TPA: DNA-directed RNA polymerase subunit alpha C-terminal domain-containing protein [Aggregatilineaceae bacterium]|nr:DNA-directed RNA polymerase subunit alpha C-terminal domain-containing protein [Aggregatilineaceae bacterium]
MARLRARDQHTAETEAREAARTSPDLSIADLGLDKRYVNIMAENGIEVVGDLLARFEESGDQGLLSISGIGRKVLADTKRLLRQRGYEVPEAEEA